MKRNDLDEKKASVPFLPEKEKKRILIDFNNTQTEYPADKTINELFEAQVEKTPENIAVVYDDRQLTYRQLNEKSNQLARILREKKVKPDSIVCLMVGRSIEMVVGMIAVLKAGGAYLPVPPDYPETRKAFMFQDSGSTFLFTQNSLFYKNQTLARHFPLENIFFLDNAGIYSDERSNLEVCNGPDNLAYVIYTSGTTGKPKGVMVSHRNTVNVLSWFGKKYHLQKEIHVLQLTDYSFDPSVEQIFGTLLHGAVLHMVRNELVSDREQLRRYIENRQINMLNFVPNVLMHIIGYGKRLKSLKFVISGGEKLDDSIKDRLIKKGYELYNHYGPTETTIDAISNKMSKEKVNLGKPISNVRCYILNETNDVVSMAIAPIGVSGELCIAGAGVARGYLNNPELTAEKFLNLAAKTREDTRNSSFYSLYKTGDLARWLPDGEIEFLGRSDFQVKIRGYRIELGEIEKKLTNHKEIKEAVVTAIETNSMSGKTAGDFDKFLCAYFTAAHTVTHEGFSKEKSLNISELREYLSKELPDYMVPSFFVQLKEIPLTPIGKVDRGSLPIPAIQTSDESAPPRDKTEETLSKLWSEVLGIEKESISIDDHFFERGGHSLNGTSLASKIHKVFNVRLRLSGLFEMPTIRKLAVYIKEASEERYVRLEKVEEKRYYALSSAQKRLFILHQVAPESTVYNIPALFELVEAPDIKRLERAIKTLIARHESLRTSFHMVNEEPVQKIHDGVNFQIEDYIPEGAGKQGGLAPLFVRASDVSRIIKSFIRPFDLSRAPLLRAGLLELNEEKHILIVDMHHIMSDGLSIDIFARELTQVYDSKPLPRLWAQYKDYSQWQYREKRKETLKNQHDYWLKEFSGEIPLLSLPLDYSRPRLQSFEGDTIYVELEKNVSRELFFLVKETNVTLYMLLLAAYNILLAKLSGQEDIVVGTPVAGRKHVEVQQVIGMFVGTLALRSFPQQEKSFDTFLREVKERTLAAFENQDYPFEELVEAVVSERDVSRNPLFDFVFALESIETETYGAAGLKLKPLRCRSNIAKFDWTVTAEVKEIKEELTLRVEYCTTLFKQESIERFIGYFQRVLAVVLRDPNKKISGIEIISAEEKQQILFDFNNTQTDYPRDKTIHQLFEEQVERTADYIALICRALPVGTGCRFIDNTSAIGSISITYNELNEKSNQLAALLIKKGVSSGGIVGIMVERSAEMVIGLLAVLKAGGAYLPVSLDYPEERKRYMLADSNVEILLRDCKDQGTYEGEAVDITDPGIFCGEPEYSSSTGANSLAYVIYTSGSTGEPKGVMVEHQSVIRLVKHSNYLAFREGDRILQTGALEFDASTFEIWGALLNGLQLHVAAKEIILVPERIKTTIQQNNITTMWMTSPLFNQMLQADMHIFGGLKNLLVGGDVLSLPHINTLKRGFPDLNIINGYGPTENTTFSTTFSIKKEYTHSIPIGRPISNSTVYIVGKDNHLVPVGIYGEILVGGDGVARGYLNNPDLTAKKFNRSYKSHMTYISYKTGDLGYWLPDGNIAFLGRVDHQVKIRGFRVELGEIESRLLAHKEIKETVVTVKENDSGNKYLCAYVVPRNAGAFGKMSGIEALREYLSKILPDYMVPSFFVPLDQLPLTGSGKVDRKALPEPEIVSSAQYAPPRNRIEEKLVEIWAEALGMEKTAIGIDDNFFKLGGNSLNGTVVASGVHKAFNVRLRLSQLFEMPSARQLSAYIKEAVEERYIPLEQAEEKAYYPLSSAQKRLYILFQMAPESTVYNIPVFFELEEAPDIIRLEHAFKKLISRHESLRTSFHMVNEEPVQKIHNEVNFKIEDYIPEGARGLAPSLVLAPDITRIIKHFIRPFDLSHAPLVRADILKTDKGRHILIVDMHHIISDGLSIDIFVRELTQIYDSKPLPLLRAQYKDYSEWLYREKQKETLKKQQDYWIKEFSGEIPLLFLPLDDPRPRLQSFEGNTITIELEKREISGLYELAEKENTSLFMVLLSVYYILLAKLSSQEDIVVGTPSLGRELVDVHHVMGMFVNTLALRNLPEGGKRFTEFLKEVKERTLRGFENQEYPFEELVEIVAPERDLSRNPLFDCVFALESTETEVYGTTGLKLKPRIYTGNIAKFDLTFTVEKKEIKETLTLRVEYCTTLFKQETIERFIGYFKKILTAVPIDSFKKISEIDIISGKEKQQILEVFNDPAPRYLTDKTIHGLFEEQVEKTPDNIALVKDVSVTYNELNKKANQLAHLLRGKGVISNGVIVMAMILEPSIEMIIGIIGILKTGGAYLPINPKDPPERKKYMLDDCGVKQLFTQKEIPLEKKIKSSYEVIYLDDESLYKNIEKKKYVEKTKAFNDLAYVIYTSGSTGNPKGVSITHSNVSPLLHWGYKQLKLSSMDRVIQNISYYFDWSVWEIFISLTSGSVFYIASRDILLNPKECARFIKKNDITVLHMTPTQVQPLVQFLISSGQKLETLKYFFIGAEKLTFTLVKDSYASVSEDCRIFNMYGPTEAAIISAVLEINRSDDEKYKKLSSIPIGKTIGNTHLLILDKHLNLCPVHVKGELVIAGDALARGYLNDPGKSSQSFVNNIFELDGIKGKRLYKTGDLVHWLPDGSIEFLGRIDHQVKIRGYRIEIGEIEKHLLSHDKIKEAVVILVQESGSQEKYLCAYIVSDHQLSISDVREHLAKDLPEYMIPPVFMQIEKMPMNPNGKVDRKRLPKPERFRPELDTDYVPPYTEMEKIISNRWKEVLQLDRVGIHDKFFDLGGNSIKFIQVNNKLRNDIGKDIPAVAMFRYPTIHSLAQYLSEEETEEVPQYRRADAKIPLHCKDIAVIGMAGRFPGAKTIDEFWKNLKNGVDSIAFFTHQELEEADITPELLANPNYVKARGFLEDTEYFDALFFNYTPLEAQLMDPQLRIYHECTWAALEDAGCNPETYPGKIGIYAGANPDISWLTNALRQFDNPSEQFDVTTLNSSFSFGTRISYNLNLRGPALSLQTACSTSLVTIHLACQGLLNEECDIALAGGVAVESEGKSGYLYQEGMIGSPDGQCRAFDAHAAGTLRGDGVGVVVLKRLEKALEEGDHIYAVVKGTAVNNDGARKIGYAAPSVEGQADVIRTALKTAGVEPESISYIEAHGTGTALGDPIEIEALQLAFNTKKRHFCGIGSVKTNIGHLDNAAGAAGFIKTVLALNHRMIPPSLHFETPNPEIDFENSPFYVNARLKEWKNDGYPLRAGVSSFGIGGTNAHIILEEAPPHGPGVQGQAPEGRQYRLILLSARTKTAFHQAVRNLVDHFKKNPGISLADAAYTLQTGRKTFKYRGMTVCATVDEAVENLSSIDARKLQLFAAPEKDRPVAFMFPGQGAQYVNMGWGLYETEPLFHREMDRCFEILESLMSDDIKEILYPSLISHKSNRAYMSNMNSTEMTHPLIFAFEYALAKLFIFWGIEPDAMIGYSFGEFAAACISGVLSLEDALTLVVTRSQLISQTPEGSMLNVPLSRETLIPSLPPQLSLAIDNGDSCLVAGPLAAVEAFEKQMKQKRVICTRLPVSKAIHSSTMEPILPAFEKKVREVTLNKPEIPYCSNVTGDWITPEQAANPGYWVTHLRETVQFSDGIKTILKKLPGVVLVEVGPGRDLSALVVRYIENDPQYRVIHLVRYPQKNVPDDRFLFNKIGRLWLYGKTMDWDAFYSGEKRYRVPLPIYPFERQAFRVKRMPSAEVAEIPPVEKRSELPVGSLPEIDFSRPELDTPYAAPQTRAQQVLAAIWQECLGIRGIGIDDDLFELGADSLKALTVINRIQKEFGVLIPMHEIFNGPSIRYLANHIGTAGEKQHPSISLEPIEKKEYYPLSSIQKRMFILNRIEGIKTAYNLPYAAIIKGEPNRQRFEQAFQRLIKRHESLRTSFAIIDDEPVQMVHENVDFFINYSEADQSEMNRQVDEFITSFDLGKAPLLRVQLVQLADGKYLFLYDMHHIVSDGISLGIFIRDFIRLYEGKESQLPELKIQYKDFSGWQNNCQEKGMAHWEKKENYWLNQFKGEIPKLDVYTDYPRPSIQRFEGEQVKCTFQKEILQKIRQLMQKSGTTLYMVLLAVYNVLLARYSGQEDIIIGTPAAGRDHVDLENTMGMFINTLPMRNSPGRDKTFRDFLNEVKESTINAYENQGYPFGNLMEKVAVIDDISRNPIFEAELLVQNIELPDWEIEGLKFIPYDFPFKASQVDIALEVWESGEKLLLTLTYSKALLKKTTMEKFVLHLQEIVSTVLNNPEISLKDIKLSHETLVVKSDVYKEIQLGFDF